MAKFNFTQVASLLQQLFNMVENPDAEPTENSTQLVTSGGVYDAIQAVEDEAKQLSYNSLMEDTASGSIASFPDGAENVPVKELTADIEPIQDLHGQASPYPENGGKNKYALTLSSLKTANTSGAWSGNSYAYRSVTFSVEGKDDNVTGISVSGTASGNVGLVGKAFTLPAGDYILSGRTNNVALRVLKQSDDSTIVQQNSSAEATFTLASDTEVYTVAFVSNGTTPSGTLYPMIRLSTEVDDTFAPYANECPIQGYMGAEIPVTGINVWDEEWELGVYDVNSGAKSTNNNYVRCKNQIPVLPSTSYYFCATKPCRILFYDNGGNWISTLNGWHSNTVITTPAFCYYVAFFVDNSYGTTYNNDISINYPSTETSYHAYNGTVYPIDWTDEAGTVYGGTLTVNEDGSCDLSVPFGIADMGDFEYLYTATWGSNYSTFTATTPVANANVPAISTAFNGLSSAYKITSRNSAFNSTDNSLVFMVTPGNLVFVNHSYSDEAAFQTAMAGQKVVYELATPQTYHLDSIGQITTLLGDNNIWSNTGDISVKYRANTALYIEKKLGA